VDEPYKVFEWRDKWRKRRRGIMIELAKKYETQLQQIFYDTALDSSFCWEWIGTGREWAVYEHKTRTMQNSPRLEVIWVKGGDKGLFD
jgi:hypothetical protein